MSLSESLDALRGYEDFLASRGADVVRRLRPGLNGQRIDDLCQRHNAVLPQDARALWMWHDGDAAGPWEDNGWTGQPGIVAWYSFPSLESTLTMLEQECPDRETPLRLPGDDEADVQHHVRDAIPIAYYSLGARLAIVDWPMKRQCVIYPGGGANGAYALYRGEYWTLPDFISMCEQCIESGLWRIYPDGQIRVDRTRQMSIYHERVKRNGGKPIKDPAYSGDQSGRDFTLQEMLSFAAAAQQDKLQHSHKAADRNADDAQEGDGHGVQ